jgi:hypothetical protein
LQMGEVLQIVKKADGGRRREPIQEISVKTFKRSEGFRIVLDKSDQWLS